MNFSLIKILLSPRSQKVYMLTRYGRVASQTQKIKLEA